MEHRGLDVAAAAQAAIDQVVRAEGDGGIIALDPRGEFAAPSADSVKYAWITNSGTCRPGSTATELSGGHSARQPGWGGQWCAA